MRIRNKIGLISATIILAVSCTACAESVNDFSVGSLSFTCIESNVSGNLYVCDQTNVMYLFTSYRSVPLIKADGTAYTLDDYKKDCSQAKIYREDI